MSVVWQMQYANSYKPAVSKGRKCDSVDGTKGRSGARVEARVWACTVRPSVLLFVFPKIHDLCYSDKLGVVTRALFNQR
jgi:hypothetical protein